MKLTHRLVVLGILLTIVLVVGSATPTKAHVADPNPIDASITREQRIRHKGQVPAPFDAPSGSIPPPSPDGANLSAASPAPMAGPVRGVAGDLWADVIIGKPDFSEFTPYEVVPFKVFNPGGVVVDRSISPGRAYIWDSGNSRILGLDLANCYGSASACSADLVIGQPAGFDHSACNGDSGFQTYPNRAPASPATLCGIPEDTLSILENKSFVSMAVDPAGHLYVPDFFNHRVLKYLSPFTADTLADEVWGQSDFSGNLCNRGAAAPTASSLCFASVFHFGAGVELDSEGNLWVADGGNNRLLRFPKDPASGLITQTADLVLGQADFTSAAPGSALDKLNSPSALRFSSQGWLYVADTGNNRVLVFDPPFTTGMSAASTFGSQFRGPYGLEMDLAGAGVWIYDLGNTMLELWDWDGLTVKKVLGKDTYRPDGICGGLLCYGGGGFGIDAEGNILPAVFAYVQDVLSFKAPIPDPQPGVVYLPDQRLFSPPEGYNYYNASNPKGLRSGTGVAVYADQLVVADGGRLLFWNGLASLSNGQPADGMIGASEFNYLPTCCGRLKTDTAGRLWVGRVEGIELYQLPLTSGVAPLTQLLLPNLTLPVLGGGSLTLGSRLDAFAPVGEGGFVWLSDTNNHRVLRLRNPLTDPVVDVVLGQTDASGTQCNRGLIPPPNSGTGQVAEADMICFPGALSLDRLGNLYVSDHTLEVEGNWRLLLFSADLFPPDNTTPIFAPPATKIFPFQNDQPAITWEPAFDALNHMAVGYNGYLGGRFVGLYADPLGPETNPSTYLNDFGSMPFSATFDEQNNLYIGDLNRSRVLIYWDPFNTQPNPGSPGCTQVEPTGDIIGLPATNCSDLLPDLTCTLVSEGVDIVDLGPFAGQSFTFDAECQDVSGGSQLYHYKTTEVVYKEGVNGYNGTHDTFIRPDDPEAVMPPLAAMEVVSRPGPTPWLRGLVRFANQQAPPANAQVLAAELTLVCQEAVPPGGVPGHLIGGGMNVGVYGLLKEFQQDQATWNQYAAGLAWETPGAEGLTDRFTAADDTQFILTKCDGVGTDPGDPTGGDVVPTPYTWNVLSSYLTQRAQGQEEYGWVFFTLDEDEDAVRFFSHEMSGENAPELVVKYVGAVEVTDLTPAQAIQNQIAEVQDLLNTGILNQGQGNALIAKLEAALKKLDQGNVNAAINQLQAFINQVNDFITTRVLSPAEGQPLIDAVNEIITALSN